MVEKTTNHLLMKRLFNLALIIGAVTLAPAAANAQQFPYWRVQAEDGTFLGWLDPNSFNSDSICNSVGTYGGMISGGIFSEFSGYGSKFNPDGVYNENAKKPPRVIDNYNRTKYRVTLNPRIRNGIHPDDLKAATCNR